MVEPLVLAMQQFEIVGKFASGCFIHEVSLPPLYVCVNGGAAEMQEESRRFCDRAGIHLAKGCLCFPLRAPCEPHIHGDKDGEHDQRQQGGLLHQKAKHDDYETHIVDMLSSNRYGPCIRVTSFHRTACDLHHRTIYKVTMIHLRLSKLGTEAQLSKQENMPSPPHG